ncbi:hypothetical protein IMZ11_33700 [Microtetraspora sp. AC03309]|uniref:hypothetical protein n=1 Tax=Microtetraspora sp. AC03309 TaxID=2779376 RepID=UPI001E516735|nr:hypothetical protein [Microtetraspora sp. AC03309]MCC5580584.1 hypothetical protein [Microtetraspora sp. AC03309]
MARTALTPVALGAAGAVLPDAGSAANIADGNSFPWRSRRQVWISNGDDTALTVTVPTPGTVGRQALPIGDATFTVAAGKARLLPPLGDEYRQADGSVHLNYAGADASVTVAVLDPA